MLALGQTPTGAESDDALIVLNLLADALGIERLLLYALTRTTTTLASGTASYTIGSGGSIDVARPTWIESAGLVLDTAATTPSEIPLPILTDDEYARVPQKTLQSSQPSAIWYDHGFDVDGYGLIYPLPIPDVATTQLVLYTPSGAVSQFADLTTAYTYPKGYGRALRKVLALELAPMYPMVTPSPFLVRQAADAKAAIKMSNVRPDERACDPGLLSQRGGHWNINAGAYR